jgi:Transmembrane secretion effector
MEFEVDHSRGREFLERLREVRLIHLRNGAFSWRLHEDLDRLNTNRVEMMVPSWTEYLLEQDRLTKSEEETIEKAWALHAGQNPPVERHFLCVNRELHTRHHQIARPSSMAEAPLSIDSIAPSAPLP